MTRWNSGEAITLDALRPAHPVPGEPRLARSIQGLEPYKPTTSLSTIRAAVNGPEPFKLDWNESTIPPSPRVLEAIQKFLGNSHHLNWYPELNSPPLQAALAGYTGVPEDHLLVTNGSDDALALVCNTFLDPSDEVVVPSPTYTHFLVFAQAAGGRIVRVWYEEPFAKDLSRVLNAISPRTKIVYLVSPNNPTGLVYGPEEVELVLEHAPQAVVIADEAYFEFHGRSVVDLVRERRNLVVTRTFSKSFGMAGLRVGYLAAHPEMVANLKRLFNPKSVNVLGQIAARAALEDREYLDAYVDEVHRGKERLLAYFRGRGVEAHDTPANFILLQTPEPKAFCAALEQQRIFVRDRSDIPKLAGYVRMTVGTLAQSEEIIRRVDTIPF